MYLSHTHVFRLQWIFAFTIGAVLFLGSVVMGGSEFMSGERGVLVDEERERTPLLGDE